LADGITHDSEILAREVVARCQTLSRLSEDRESICRTFLSPPMRDVHREISGWAAACGATSTLDAAGNIRLLYPALDSDAPRFLIGSHLDTVPNAGAYDGVLGVVLGIALLSGLRGRRLPFAIEVIGFSEEEGIRFRRPFIGSRALAGTLDDKLLGEQDSAGVSIRQAIQNYGLHADEIADAAIGEDVFGFLEFHIEQGPVLDKVGQPLGIVESIVGQSRLEFTFVGQSNHAGTTPMESRYDALAAAAEWIVAVEQKAVRTSGLVATVGAILAKPCATNVIAGETRVSLDLRHRDDETRKSAVEYFIQRAEDIITRRGLKLIWCVGLDQPAVLMSLSLLHEVEQAFRKADLTPFRMASGAGHDAMILAEKVPSAMIFLRTPGGISHDPAETVELGDVAKAIECGLHLLERFTSSSEFMGKRKNA